MGSKKLFYLSIIFIFFGLGSVRLVMPWSLAELEASLTQINKIILRVNEAVALAHNESATVCNVVDMGEKAQVLLEHLKTDISNLQQEVGFLQGAVPQFRGEISEITQQQKTELMQLAERLKAQALSLQALEISAAKARIEAEIEAKEKRGIYEKEARILGQAHIDGEIKREATRWACLRDPKFITGYALAIIAIALSVYSIKYGLPIILNRYTQPRVISETSIGMRKPSKMCKLDDLVFAPALQQQLSHLSRCVQQAKKYQGSYPNILFYGHPGAGKTAFAKAVAYASGLDYALTSGSEFTKITDLNEANNELRRLLRWAKKSRHGLIVFIDEAEVLFASRKLSSTPRQAQELINTFFSLVSDQFQKKVMFIFATNHPHKLDEALLNRVGSPIEFVLPGAAEREKILLRYLLLFAKENKKLPVTMHQDVKLMLRAYAESLAGFSPRALKFIAYEMVVKARMSKERQVTPALAQAVICQAKAGQQQLAAWGDYA